MANQSDSQEKKSSSQTSNQQGGTGSTQNRSDDKGQQGGGGMGNARPDDGGKQADKSGGKGDVSQQSGSQKGKEQPEADRDSGGSSRQTRSAQDEKGQA